jgi:surface antigen
MDAGDECTNYVAYVESTVYHAPTPGYTLGDAGFWPGNAAAHGVVVNDTPSVGAVAEFDPGSAGIPYPGHVAVVEQVGPHNSWIDISQQNISTDADGYDWMRINPSNPGSGWEQWPSHFIHFAPAGGTHAPGGGSGSGERLAGTLAPAGIVSNGGFAPGDGGGWRASPHSSFAVYGPGAHTRAYQGAHYGVTSTSAQGGGIFQEINEQVKPGESFCAQAEVVTIGRESGARGQLLLYFFGGRVGTPAQSSSVGFGPLAGGNSWHAVTTCLTATSAHSVVRIQVAPAAHGPLVGVDAVDVHESLAADGGFDANDGGGWQAAPGSWLTVLRNRVGVTGPYEGNGFAATSAHAPGGGIYEDIHLPVAAGTSYCASAEVTTVGGKGAHGAGGSLDLWLLGGAHHVANEVTSSNFGGLAAGTWSPVSTCVTATSAYSMIRVQFYDAAHTPALGIDAVDVHASLAANGNFARSARGDWQASPHSNFVIFGTPSGHRTHRTFPYEGGTYGATATTASGGGFHQDVNAEVMAGESYCAQAEVVTAAGGRTGAGGTMEISFEGGGRNQAATVSFGPLAGGNSWTPVTTCLTATSNHSMIRIDFFPAPRSPTLGVDTVDIR